VASFAGFAPAERPAVTILVVIDSPVGQIYGAEVAAPAFKSIAEQTLAYLHASQQIPSVTPLVASLAPSRVPRQVRGKAEESPPRDLESSAATSLFPPAQPVRYRLASRDQQVQEPPKWPLEPPGSGIMLINQGPLLTVPDFTGWPLRRVAEKCQVLSLELNIRGTGVAVNQNPAAGTIVSAESGITVQFSR